MKTSCVYILSNKNRTVLYIGVTSNLEKRMLEHKTGNGSVFTKKYNLFDLLYFETYTDIRTAILREKQLKNWRSEWKWNLVKIENPELSDLSAAWFNLEDINEQMLKQVQHDEK